MKELVVCSVLLVVVLSVCASTIQLPTSGDFDHDGMYQDAAEIIPQIHGKRMKRSPLDPIVAPLLIGKSFLYGALLGPKLFHRPRYYHYYPKQHYGWGQQSYGGWGQQSYGGWGWRK